MHKFIKMHGLGNDFAIFDKRKVPLELNSDIIISLGDRRRSIGFDQLILLETSDIADIFMNIYNQDGSEVAACGNATRCVARIICEENNIASCKIATKAGILYADKIDAENYQINMGQPITAWQDIPLSHEMNFNDIDMGRYGKAFAVSMGNPHCIFFIDDIENIDLTNIGGEIEYHPYFPQRANVSFAKIIDGRIILRVWERGAGITLGCGTAACAAFFAANHLQMVGNAAIVSLPGGNLQISRNDMGEILMSGEAIYSYHGEISLTSCEEKINPAILAAPLFG
jgi:diaminopimelate epimerase